MHHPRLTIMKSFNNYLSLFQVKFGASNQILSSKLSDFQMLENRVRNKSNSIQLYFVEVGGNVCTITNN